MHHRYAISVCLAILLLPVLASAEVTVFKKRLGEDRELAAVRREERPTPTSVATTQPGQRLQPVRSFFYTFELRVRGSPPRALWKTRADDYGNGNYMGVDPLIEVFDAHIDHEILSILYRQAGVTYGYVVGLPGTAPADFAMMPSEFELFRDSVALGDTAIGGKLTGSAIRGDLRAVVTVRYGVGRPSDRGFLYARRGDRSRWLAEGESQQGE